MKAILASVVCIGLGAFMLWFMGPAIFSDLTADSTEFQQSPIHRIEKAECKSRIFIVASCDLEAVNVTNNEKSSFDYMMLGRMGGESVYVMVRPQDGQLTTNIGLDYAWNRLLMLILFGGGLLLAGLFVLYNTLFGKPKQA